MKWKKLGLLYVPDGERTWAVSHAASPTASMPNEDRVRIFVALLDRAQVGRIGYVDVEAANPLRVLQVSREPVLDIGVPGTFDDNGVMPISLG